jgi:bifunctional UDP-N-acetylglucosamine pyrophosphorylase/glucosamine-1-phosphate N-acetyltransferase
MAIILAAGEGTRMKSAKAKVLHEVAGRTLIGHVLKALELVQPQEVRIVLGSRSEEVKSYLQSQEISATLDYQEQRLGTGHATKLSLGASEQKSGNVIVLAADTPLLRAETISELLAFHQARKASATILTAELLDPFGYGRIIRSDDGRVVKVVEEKDCSDFERSVSEINSGVYIFNNSDLREALASLKRDNAQAEEYLTDVIAYLVSSGKGVEALLASDENEILGVNDREQLAQATAFMRDRINSALMRDGVTMVDPTTTWVDLDVQIAPDVTLLPATALFGKTIVETGAVIGPRTTLIDCTVGQSAHIFDSHCQGASIGYQAKVGPFTFLREGSELATGVKIGAYVEVKNSSIGEGSKVPHLSYVGDASIGRETNIGAATVFVNYDGVEKHRSEIGDHVRIGSDTMLVAPISIGDGAYTAAGSVITEDVPAGAIGVGRAKQRNILGWVAKRRPGSKSAKAAEKSKEES